MKSGNGELSIREECEVEQANQKCGRLEKKFNNLMRGSGTLWEEDYKRQQTKLNRKWTAVECAGMRRDHPNAPMPRISGNPVP